MIYLSLHSLLNVDRSAFSSTDTLTDHVLLYFLCSNHQIRKKKQNQRKTERKRENKNNNGKSRRVNKNSWKFLIFVPFFLLHLPVAPCSYHNFSLCLYFLSLNLHLTDYNRIDWKSDYQGSNCTCNTTMWTLSVFGL